MMMMEPPFVPSSHDFDEDALIDDFVDDEDFASHPATNDDEAYFNEMMMLENEQQQQNPEPQTDPGATRRSATHGNDKVDDDMEDVTATATSADVNTNNNNNNIQMNVDDSKKYLSSRLSSDEEKLFSFERYQQNIDWRRTPLSPNSTNGAYRSSQPRASKHSRHYENFLLASRSRVKAAAADSQLLELLQWRENHINPTCGEKALRLSKLYLCRDSQFNKNTSNVDVLQYPQEGVDTVPMTLADGTRVYVRCRPTDLSCSGTTDTAGSTPVAPTSSSSLGVGMRELKCRVDAITRRSLAAKEKRTSGAIRGGRIAMMTQESDLWVDKHAPASFPHLLSDERTNREVLRTLRAWDPYVFGRDPPSRPTSHMSYNQQQQGQVESKSNKGDNGFKSDRSSMDKRPEESQRVILLSGPPGVGKTTLAHIVARHAGYRPMEVNASDDRSAGVLEDCIRRAMESTTITFQPTTSGKLPLNGKPTHEDYGKPNCLILDEIDGADAKGAIQALVEIIRADIPTKQAKQKSPYLRRPIICICNHKYAPALRPLLPYAVHFNVDPPSSARLVARLKAILNEERLAMMSGGSLLHQLVVSTSGDIRSCLFTLQFAASQAEDSKDLSNALSASLSGSGLKDDRNDLASTITSIFRKDKLSIKGKTFGTIGLASSGELSSVSRVIDCVESLSDDTAAANALFLNVLRVSYIDPAFDRCSAAHELLSAADFHGGDGSIEFYSMQKICTPPLAAAIHLLCRVEVKPSLTISTRELADIQYRKEANQGLVQKFSEVLPTKAKNLKCATILSEEIIPLALWVLSAGDGSSSLRRAASSIEILSKMERDTADAHVAALCSLGLTYVPDTEFQHTNHKSADHAGTPLVGMRLEPPIHRLVQYNSVGAPMGVRRQEIPSAMKELLAHQVRLLGFMNREDSVTSKKDPTTVSAAALVVESDTPSSPETGGKARSNDTLSTPGSLKSTPRRLEQFEASATIPDAKRIKTTPSPTAGNFLGIAAKKGKEARSARRAASVGLDRSSSLKYKMAHTGSGFQLNHVIRMKYVKGFTQAVRTPCRLQDLE